MKKPKSIHVISGTHWDREWRFTAEQSLLRLSELIDDLLDILEKNQDYICFHLDGGTIVIEDYLAVRPENAERLCRLIQQGRIATVMWYSLPEMSTVAPEALIRNLLIGKRLADKFGGSMKTGYTATSYGQISQLPQIYAGFDIDTALSYRGSNKHQVPPICRWQSPDGTQIYHIRCFDEVTRTNWFFFIHYELVLNKLPRQLETKWNTENWPVHMADEKLYQTAFQLKNEDFNFSKNRKKVLSALEHLVEQAKPQAIGDKILALDMEDNACPYQNLPKLIKTINKAQDKYFVKQLSLDDYVEVIKKAVKGKKLHVHKGEMRFTAIEVGFNGLLGTTHSSRIPLKLMNNEAQTELIGIAEPLSGFCSMLGGSYEKTLLDRAWLELLKNHAHDSICGAAINEAHKDNPTRFRTVTAIARECSRKASEQLWAMLNTKTGFKDGDITITFFNTLSKNRKGVQPIIIDTPDIVLNDPGLDIALLKDEGPIREGIDPDKMVTYRFFDIVDENSRKIPYQLLEQTKVDMEIERRLDTNSCVFHMRRNQILMDVDIPAFGYRTYALRPRKRKYITNPKPGPDRALIAQPGGILENKFIKVTINPNGTFNITDKQNNKHIEGMHYFCDNGSVGNAHQNKVPLRDYTITSLGSSAVITLLENNTLRATWQIDLVLEIPACADLDSSNRSTKMVLLPVITQLTLSKNSKRLEIKTHIDNSARDHRLRVMFPTDIKTDWVCTGAPFDVVSRRVQWNVTAENKEEHHPFQPMQDFVDLTDGKSAMAFFGKGLGEYEVVDDPRRTLAVTLLRTHRSYMLANKGAKTPEEYNRQEGHHCLGPVDYEYALYFHKGDWFDGDILAQAQDFKIGQRIIQGIPKSGELAASNSFITVTPAEHVHFSALYKSEDGYILRLWNSLDKSVQASIKTSIKFKSVTKVTMDEQRRERQLVQKKGSWILPLRKAEITTLLIQI